MNGKIFLSIPLVFSCLFSFTQSAVKSQGKKLSHVGHLSQIEGAYNMSNDNSTIAAYVKKVDKLVKSGDLDKYFYVNMSFCGGGLYGYYKGDELIFIASVYGGELGGFRAKDVYWRNDTIVQLNYQEYFPNYEAFNEKIPELEYEENLEKMIYSDTSYHLTFGQTFEQVAYCGNTQVIRPLNEEEINYLIECAYSMREELDSDSVLEK